MFAKIAGRIRIVAPGLGAALLVALAARWIHGLLPPVVAKTLGEVLFAVFLGLLVSNVFRMPAVLAPGIRFSFQAVLRLAIVLLGASFSFAQVAAIGGKALVMIVVLMSLALWVAHSLGRRLGVRTELATLIGVGTAVCGNTAISATAPVIRAKDEDVSFAVATNTIMGTIAVFAYPILARVFGMSDAQFGTWVGSAVNDTSQVVAAGFAVSEAAGRVATAVKLTRNALMGIVIIGTAMAYARRSGSRTQVSWFRQLKGSVPLFVIGFLLMAIINTLGGFAWFSSALGRNVGADLVAASRFLILVALAGVGLGTNVAAMRRTGMRPFLLGFTTAVLGSVVSLLLIRLLGPAGG
jgi:uncharacterized integral membrane protein (TIGR00698 family)